MKERKLIPNAPILIESTRSIGYSFEAALADVIDNSVGKNAKRVDVLFDSQNEPYLAIIDDACGMSSDELEMAMRYGSRSSLENRDDNDLGRFGLGLKMASLSQCRSLTVMSKKNKIICAVKWDLDYVVKTNEWTLQEYEQNELCNIRFYDRLNSYETGTLVLWENFDRIKATSDNLQKTFDEKISIAKEHVSLIYHRYLEEINGLKLFFNGYQIKPKDPFLQNSPGTQKLAEQTIIFEGKEITVKPFILPHLSKLSESDHLSLGDVADLKQKQGIYIYRNKRLVIYGSWLRLRKNQELNKLARVRVDIPNSLDDMWDIDIKKSQASLPDIIKKDLANIIDNAIGRSEKVFKYRGRKENSDTDFIHFWNVIKERETYKYEINTESYMYKNLVASFNEEQAMLFKSFVRCTEDTFPFSDVYQRIAKNGDMIINKDYDFEEYYSMGVDFLNNAKIIGINMKNILLDLPKNELFRGKDDVIEKLRKDFGDE